MTMTQSNNKPAPDTAADELTIVQDPFIASMSRSNKYDEKFLVMKPGEGLRMKTQRVSRIADALRHWISRSGRVGTLHVKSVREYTYPDGRVDTGYGRVWMMAGPPTYGRPTNAGKKIDTTNRGKKAA